MDAQLLAQCAEFTKLNKDDIRTICDLLPKMITRLVKAMEYQKKTDELPFKSKIKSMMIRKIHERIKLHQSKDCWTTTQKKMNNGADCTYFCCNACGYDLTIQNLDPENRFMDKNIINKIKQMHYAICITCTFNWD